MPVKDASRDRNFKQVTQNDARSSCSSPQRKKKITIKRTNWVKKACKLNLESGCFHFYCSNCADQYI